MRIIKKKKAVITREEMNALLDSATLAIQEAAQNAGGWQAHAAFEAQIRAISDKYNVVR